MLVDVVLMRRNGVKLSAEQLRGIACAQGHLRLKTVPWRAAYSPQLPTAPTVFASLHPDESCREPTLLSLCAAFNTKTGEVLGKTATRHTSAEFVAPLTDIVANQPRGKEIHVIADNLSARKTKQVDAFLAARRSICTSPRPILRGSTRWSCGSPRPNAT